MKVSQTFPQRGFKNTYSCTHVRYRASGRKLQMACVVSASFLFSIPASTLCCFGWCMREQANMYVGIRCACGHVLIAAWLLSMHYDAQASKITTLASNQQVPTEPRRCNEQTFRKPPAAALNFTRLCRKTAVCFSAQFALEVYAFGVLSWTMVWRWFWKIARMVAVFTKLLVSFSLFSFCAWTALLAKVFLSAQ